MSKHTPGPWRVTRVGTRDVLVNVNGNRLTYLDDDSGKANARLMAAAPELLGTFRVIEQQLTDWGIGDDVDINGADAVDYLNALLLDVRAVIAKATGESYE